MPYRRLVTPGVATIGAIVRLMAIYVAAVVGHQAVALQVQNHRPLPGLGPVRTLLTASDISSLTTIAVEKPSAANASATGMKEIDLSIIRPRATT